LTTTFKPIWLLVGKKKEKQWFSKHFLEENNLLIHHFRDLMQYQNKSQVAECTYYYHILCTNILYLITLTEASPTNPQKRALEVTMNFI
uniref:SS18 N-terminal domain-containing protein n=1 Tax=Spermophilus dauricus TaxID=99837 RepID=A0A8C9QJN3_SPEDA